MSIRDTDNQVILHEDHLSQIAKNIKETGIEKVAIVSIMGAYRTGKSFLLDLFLRYLRYKSRVSSSKSTDSESGNSPNSTAAKSHLDGRSNGEFPAWLDEEGDVITEGRAENEDSTGFHWRGGMEKCTQGLWLWSEPFIIQGESLEDHENHLPEKIAVLLLDSQGAFDSQMTKEQSATIFGLTAVLSSLQIYNISMQIQEDKIESLHYFLECAGSCARFLNEKEHQDIKLFQRLEFLVRDWPNFDERWDLATCEKQMNEHMKQHLDNARDSSTPDAIKSMFEEVSCWLLPHPGLKINRVTWDGRVSDLSPEFVKLLDAYVIRTFGPGLRPRTILGKPLLASSLVSVTNAFVEAFKDLVPKGANLATAIAASSNLLAKEQSLSEFKSSLERAIESGSGRGLQPEDFAKNEKKVRVAAIDHFMRSTNFGPQEDRDAVKIELIAEMDNLRAFYEIENRRRMESALTVFAGLMLLVGILYSIDKVSDFTCDWYSDTCVKMSNALFLIYFTILVAVLTNVYFLYQSRGQTVAFMAIFEMGKASTALLLEYGNRIMQIFSALRDPNSRGLREELTNLMHRIISDITDGMRAIHLSVREAYSKVGSSE